MSVVVFLIFLSFEQKWFGVSHHHFSSYLAYLIEQTFFIIKEWHDLKYTRQVPLFVCMSEICLSNLVFYSFTWFVFPSESL